MRTTVSIDDALLARAKARAAQRRQSLGSVLEDALREHLSAPERRAILPVLPVAPGGRLRPGIPATSNRALYDALDESEATPA